MNKYLLMHQHYCMINNCTQAIKFYIIHMRSDEDVSDQRKLSITLTAGPFILPLLFSRLIILQEICIQTWLHLV